MDFIWYKANKIPIDTKKKQLNQLYSPFEMVVKANNYATMPVHFSFFALIETKERKLLVMEIKIENYGKFLDSLYCFHHSTVNIAAAAIFVIIIERRALEIS